MNTVLREREKTRTGVNTYFPYNSPVSNSLNASKAHGRLIARYYDIIKPWLEPKTSCIAYTILTADSHEGQKNSCQNKYSKGAKEEAGQHT